MMEFSIALRQPRPDDMAVIRHLVEDLGYRPSPEPRIPALLAEIEGAGGETWLAVVGDEPVGLLTLLFFPSLREGGTAGRIEELVVASGWRGRGIGTRLLEHAEARARDVGALWLELQTARSRSSYARRFYPSRGYEELDAALFRTWLSERDSRSMGR